MARGTISQGPPHLREQAGGAADLTEQIDMMTVPLHGKKAAGRVALVDDEDYGFVLPYRWNLQPCRTSGAYAIANAIRFRDGKPTTVKMHQVITGWAITDHINGDGLDNRRANLRPATPAQNAQNRRKHRPTSSQYKGVSWNKRERAWVALLRSRPRITYLGKFASEVEAARAYDAAALEAWGEYACLNFPGLPPLDRPETGPCRGCGGVVPPGRRADAVYCSDECRTAFNQKIFTERRRQRNAAARAQAAVGRTGKSA